MRYFAFALAFLCAGTASAEPIELLTEDYPPFSFIRDGRLQGISVDQVRVIMERSKIEYTMELQPWARAFSLAENKPGTCVFTTGMLPDRKARFKWVHPLVVDIMIMVRHAGQPFSPVNLDDAKRFTVGVHRDDSAETYAKQQGFPYLDSAPSLDVSLRKLLSDRVQLMIMTRTTYETLKQRGEPIEAVLDLEGTRAGIACNRSLPDALVERMQAALDRIIADGTEAAIYRGYETTGK